MTVPDFTVPSTGGDQGDIFLVAARLEPATPELVFDGP